MDHEWTTSQMIDAEGSPRMEERQLEVEAASSLSVENVNVNLNSDHVANDHSFSHNSNLSDTHQNSDQNARCDDIIPQVVETGISSHFYNPSLVESQHFSSSSSSSDTFGNSSLGAGILSEDGGVVRRGAFDGRRVTCKRKNSEGVAGPSSAYGSSSTFREIENSSPPLHTARHNVTTGINIFNSPEFVSDSRASDVRRIQRSTAITTGLAYEPNPSLTIPEIAESSQRNFRMRLNLVHQHDIPPRDLIPSDNGSRHPSTWQTQQPSNLLVPFNQSPESRPAGRVATSHAQPRFSSVSSWPQNVHPPPQNGTYSSSSSIGRLTALREETTALREETNSNSTLMNGIPDYSLFEPTADVRQLTQDRANGSMSMLGDVASTSGAGINSGVHQSVGPAWVPQHNPPLQRPLSVSEVAHQSLFPSGAPQSGNPNNNFHIQHLGHSVNSQEIAHQSIVDLRGNQRPPRRSTFLMDRQNDGVPSIPLPVRNLAARERRHRMMSEIRNALELMRRGENLRFEDAFILDDSVLLSGAGLHDRHRDMRLDVDDMSYEELLALEERIGDVSTGLSEETILKLLKHQKYLLSVAVEASEVKPCCICREEYIEGEEVGTLDCGHDFHAACIKQWLMHKNLCPICKTTALVT